MVQRAPARRLRALVFDMDGTLIDSARAIPAAYIATIRDIDGKVLTSDEVIAAYSVGPPHAMLSHFLGREAIAAEVDHYHRILQRHANGITAFRGIQKALTALGQKVSLAVFTGASRRACHMLLDGAGLLRHFDAVVGGDEVKRPKPAPDGIDLACRRLNVAPEAAAYIGDAPNDLEAGRRSGALAVAAAWGHENLEGAGADEVVESPELLLRLLGE
jgi:HAD superfamily hydrolase (TIGR01509 family)